MSDETAVVQLTMVNPMSRSLPDVAKRLTRRQWLVKLLLDGGAVAELIVPKTKRHAPSRYIMRHAGALEADGIIVNGKTIEHLLSTGAAVKCQMPGVEKTWVFSRKVYESQQRNQ